MRESAALLGVKRKVFNSFTGAVFEIRQGYKSKDTKRQNADIESSATAYTQGYLPCFVVLSGQFDRSVVNRYRAGRWSVLTGNLGSPGPTTSTYDFMREIIGYDLAEFFKCHSPRIRDEINEILNMLLRLDVP